MLSSRPWPSTAPALRLAQRELAAAQPPAWRVPGPGWTIGGCFVCFARGAGGPGAAGDPGWAGAALGVGSRIASSVAVGGQAGYRYEPGLLALREGQLLAAVVSALPQMPDVLLVNATGRDHPLRAGLALHLGAILELPTVGVTHRPLLARGEWPPDEFGARGPLLIGREEVGCWLRTRAHARPLAVHPAWRTDADTACATVLSAVARARTPEPLREARHMARLARARAQTARP